MRGIIVAAALTAAALLAGCGGGGAPMSAADAARATGNAADQALVCHHYMKQRAWIRGITTPTLADAFQAEAGIAVDVTQSEGTGKLHADLAAMYQAGKAGRDVHAASERVYQDCAAIGITG
jgi:ABC-type glycerol-3-phosphate transport system substrate-binding protein